jgi:uncharacterized phage-associated protein
MAYYTGVIAFGAQTSHNKGVNNMYDVIEIAKWFLNRDRITDSMEDSDGISNLKLQKLLYYAQGASLVINGYPLFNDPLLAWTHGPVVERVYHAYKQYGSHPIPFEEAYDDSQIAEKDKEVLEGVYQSFSQYSAWKLRQMTHEEEPWKNTPSGAVISPALIKDYFKREIVDWS